MKTIRLTSFLIVTVSLSLWAAEESFMTLRDRGILEQSESPPLAPQEDLAHRRVRDHPTEAPTIPHPINGYTVTKEFNQCLLCHDKNVAPLLNAPAVAVSHFTNRDGEYLVNISPRRYFCTQCHVAQTTSNPPVNNLFKPPAP
jgi:cytochrome c-type protein NapB